MKKLLSIVISISLCLLTLCFGPAGRVTAADAIGMAGSGTQSDPYIIMTAEQLKNLASSGLDKCYKLGCSIDLSSYSVWTPVGNFNTPFTGTLDGANYTISNLKQGAISNYNKDVSGSGLFDTVSNATIENLNVTVAIYNGCGGYLGTIAGQATSCNFKNCHSTGEIRTTTDTIAYTGGLVGQATSCNFENCDTSLTIVDTFTWVGGLVGYSRTSTYSKCHFAGNITKNYASTDYVGGLIGFSSNDGNIISCYTTGEVHGSQFMGGLIGYYIGSGTSIISKCYSSDVVTDSGNYSCKVGGLIGHASYSNIVNSYTDGGVGASMGWAGAIIGAGGGYNKVTNCYSTAGVYGHLMQGEQGFVAGALIGSSSDDILTNCYHAGIYSSNDGTNTGMWGSDVSTVASCYFNLANSNYYSLSGIGMSSANMETQVFADTLNANIKALKLTDSVAWKYVANKNNGLPILSGVGVGADTDPPTGSYTLSKSSWTCNPVKITVSATDEGSGVASITTPDGNVISGSSDTLEVNDNGTYNFTLTDNSGNSCTYPVTVSNIDRTISITHPLTVSYTIDPNTETLTGGEIPIINNSQHIGVSVSVQSFTTTGIANVTPDQYADWRVLTAAQTAGSIALGLKVKEASPSAGGWNKISQTSAFYSTSPENPVQLGIINVCGTGNLSLCAKYGLAWASQTSVQHNLTLVFNCADVN